MTKEQALAELDSIQAALEEQFRDEHGTHRARLEQLAAHLDTARMAIEHLYAEEAREVDLARRLVRREKVHADEVRDPHGRPHEHVAAVAGRA